MLLRRRVRWTALCAAVGILAAVGAQANFLTIGNPGNDAASPTNAAHGEWSAYGYGSVPYTYQISKTAVSVAEWDLFYGDGTTGPNGVGGGTAVGSFDPAYNYWNDGTRTVGPNAPAVRISFHHVAQYVNWLTTGNATEGAYMIDIDGVVTDIMSRAAILATGNLYYLIPTQDEWYKAAYFQPDGSGYTLYAHGLDTAPPQSPDGLTGWNWYDSYHSGLALPSPNFVWTVDSGTEEQNGTFNMMGNVWEWNELLMLDERRGIRGGPYFQNYIRAADRGLQLATHGNNTIGFRAARIIPEPASGAMLLAGAVGLLLWRRRRTAGPSALSASHQIVQPTNEGDSIGFRGASFSAGVPEVAT